MIQRITNLINRAHLRFMAFCYRDYSSKEITDAINMYYDICADMVCAQSMDEIKPMFIDIDVFKKRFKGTIPPDMYYERIDRLKYTLSKETERIMQIKKKPILTTKPLFRNN